MHPDDLRLSDVGVTHGHHANLAKFHREYLVKYQSNLANVLVTGLLTSGMLLSTAFAEAYDDCVLNGLKGVSSDAAARLVAQSCRNKISDSSRAKMAKFGTKLQEGEFVFVTGAGSVQNHEGGYFSRALKNSSSFNSITYVSLVIKDGDYYDFKPKGGIPILRDVIGDIEEKGKWERERSHVFFYQLSLKPGKEVRLMFRAPRGESFYSEVVTVLGREAKWSDTISANAFSTNVKPESRDPLE
jgi:hypothetical protein